MIKLDKGGKSVPESIKGVIEPSFEQLGNIQFASKFQHDQLTVLIKHLEGENVNLKTKNNRFKELLRKSRVELDKCNEYQKEIERLKEENGRLMLKIQIGDSTGSSYRKGTRNADDSDDMGIDEISVDEFNFAKSRSSVASKSSGSKMNKKEDFVSKMRKFSQSNTQSSVGKENIKPLRKMSSRMIEKGGKKVNRIGSSSFNIEAESTTLRKGGDRSMSLQLPLITKQPSKINLVTSTAGNTSGFGNSRGQRLETGSGVGGLKKKFMFKPPSRNLSGGKVGGFTKGILTSDIIGHSSVSTNTSDGNALHSLNSSSSGVGSGFLLNRRK